MGGPGSGRWHDHQRRKTRSDAVHAIDVRSLAAAFERGTQRGMLRSPSGDALHVWILADATPDSRRLLFAAQSRFGSWHAFAEVVEALGVRQPFGGRRWWLVCAGCGRRRVALFQAASSDRFRCRACEGLVYSTQRLSPKVRAARRLARAVRLIAPRAPVDLEGCCPFRPPRMHRSTYARLKARWERCSEAYEWESLSRLARFIGPYLPTDGRATINAALSERRSR